MHFSTATALTVLAAVTQASAWTLTFYDNVDNCDANDSTQYQIIEGNQGDCYTFGASMPRTSCEHFTGGGVNKQGCKGLFKAKSVAIPRGRNCQFYGLDFCQSLSIYGDETQCKDTLELLAGPADYIRSFKCENDE
ncbi:hypothetical protein NW752_011678 [Fusarium irregulare]|uniref:Secreted LysM effector LysM C-terminal domain-containing protein n=1 Tax=Fusarium irregulare TaxID=2494466 RepID=A0A9W8PDG3_9HYPO|nr:hypothetical protein NW766_012465 [Fusarium irregulare]KAJ4004581.1 hypothetical protein NW752_011678 [Fusarium irregulare]